MFTITFTMKLAFEISIDGLLFLELMQIKFIQYSYSNFSNIYLVRLQFSLQNYLKTNLLSLLFLLMERNFSEEHTWTWIIFFSSSCLLK